MSRNRLRTCRLAAAAIVAPVLFAGTAYLASNSVASSSMGRIQVPVVISTTMSAGTNATVDTAPVVNKGVYRFAGVAARLSIAGTRIPGEPVEFTAAGGLICTAITDSRGRAVCPGNTKVDTSTFGASVPTTFTATFAGDGGLQPSSDTGTLTEIS